VCTLVSQKSKLRWRRDKGEGSQQVPSANSSQQTSCSSIEPSIQIISDDLIDEGEIIPELNAEEATDASLMREKSFLS